MKVNSFYLELRGDLLKVISGVENSGGCIYWDNTTPNHMIKKKLENIYDNYFNLASEHFGIYKITRHTSCHNKGHYNVDDGYPTTNEHGISVKYKDPMYIWTGIQLYQGERKCICPCDKKNKVSTHTVIDEIIYRKINSHKADTKEITEILNDILIAIDNSDDRKPRSAIRERLLMAIIRINDQLLPMPMDEFIKKYF